MEAWIYVMDCPTECAYEDHLTKFEVVCAPWGEFAAYVKETWLILHKKRFVKALTDKVMHMGSTTTNR